MEGEVTTLAGWSWGRDPQALLVLGGVALLLPRAVTPGPLSRGRGCCTGQLEPGEELQALLEWGEVAAWTSLSQGQNHRHSRWMVKFLWHLACARDGTLGPSSEKWGL